MKRLAAAVFGLCLIATSAVAFWQSRDSNYNVAISSGGGGGSLSLDGTPVAASQSSTTITLAGFSTAAGTGKIIVCILSNAATISSVTAPGLTFTNRSGFTGGSGFSIGSVYTAPYSTNFSGTVTVTLATATAGRATVFAVANSTAFDAGGPQTTTGTAATMTTANAVDFVYTMAGTSATTPTAGAGWTLITGVASMLVEFQLPTSTGTFTTSVGTGTLQGSIIDAVH